MTLEAARARHAQRPIAARSAIRPAASGIPAIQTGIKAAAKSYELVNARVTIPAVSTEAAIAFTFFITCACKPTAGYQ
jgi:hypothetical protein